MHECSHVNSESSSEECPVWVRETPLPASRGARGTAGPDSSAPSFGDGGLDQDRLPILRTRGQLTVDGVEGIKQACARACVGGSTLLLPVHVIRQTVVPSLPTREVDVTPRVPSAAAAIGKNRLARGIKSRLTGMHAGGVTPQPAVARRADLCGSQRVSGVVLHTFERSSLMVKLRVVAMKESGRKWGRHDVGRRCD